MIELSVFVDFLTERGCVCEPHEGGNLTGTALKITRTIPNSNISRKFYLQLYSNGLVSKTTISLCCKGLLLDEPTSI